MRSFTFESLSPQEFDDFSFSDHEGNFQQTSAMAEVRRKDGAEVEFFGVREDGKLVAATALEYHHNGMSQFAQVHDGPLCDYHDTELVSFLFKELKSKAKKAGCAQMEITPEIPYLVRDSFGEELPKGPNAKWPLGTPIDAPVEADREAFDNIVAQGFEHSGFVREYTAVPRWRYLKDLHDIKDEAALLKSYNKNTKRNVRIANESGVIVRRAKREDLAEFHRLCELSGEKHGFENRSVEYFEQILDCLGDNAEYCIAYIDTRAYLESWLEKRDGFQKEVQRLEKSLPTANKPARVERQLKDQRSKYEASLKRIEQAQKHIDEDGEMVPVSAALFIWHPQECVYLFSGGDQRYAKFYAATALQHHAMLECIERGVPSYNFYGIDGVFDDPKDPGYGVLEFKQGFNGYVEELMGSFTLPVKPMAYAAKKLAHKVLGR